MKTTVVVGLSANSAIWHLSNQYEWNMLIIWITVWYELFQGLEYIHKSPIHFHGNLRSTNCVVDSRWTCKLTDFGVPVIREMDKVVSQQTGEEVQWESRS